MHMPTHNYISLSLSTIMVLFILSNLSRICPKNQDSFFSTILLETNINFELPKASYIATNMFGKFSKLEPLLDMLVIQIIK